MTATCHFILRELANDPHLDHRTFQRLHDLAVELAGMTEPQREAALHQVAVEARRQADEREAAFSAHVLAVEAQAAEERNAAAALPVSLRGTVRRLREINELVLGLTG